MSNAPTRKRTNEPSVESLAEMPEVDFSKAKRIVRPGKQRVALAVLRKVVGKTQVEIAAGAEMTQGEIARLEGREDMLVSTLHRYAGALGGELDIAVVLDGRRYRLAL